MCGKKISCGGFELSEDGAVYMIAEIGINHNGSLEIAKRLLDAVYACGWNCGKFQKRTPDICVPEHQKDVMRDTPWGKMSYLNYKKKIEFGKTEYDEIDKYCKDKPIHWSASPWDKDSLQFLLNYDLPFIKIASASLTDHDLLRTCAYTGKTIFLSTGMSSLEEIDCAVEVLEKHASNNYVLMHTNSAYPAPVDELNLKTIPYLKERYGCLVGYSGHEQGLEPTVVAVALGACVVERHITLDHNMWGTDHSASLEVHGMDMLRKRLKDVRNMLGSGEKTVTEKEMVIRKKLRGN